MDLLATLVRPASPPWALTAFLCVVVFVLLWVWLRYRQLQEVHRLAVLEHLRDASIVDASGEGLLELDQAGRVRYANPAALRKLGYLMEEIVGRDYRRLVNTGLSEGDTDVRRIGLTTDMVQGVGAMLLCKNGRRRPVEYRIVPVIRDGSTLSTVLAFRDVSERVRLDAMLKDMQQTARVGAWEVDLGSGRMSITAEVSRRLGLPDDRSYIKATQALVACHPDDIEKVRAATRAAVVYGTSFDIELRMASSRDAWMRCIGRAERINGRTVRLYGTLQEITDLRQAQRKLRETRDFYEATLDAMPSLVLHTDTHEKITYCNQAVVRAFGRSADQIIGTALSELLSADDYAGAREHIAAALAGEARSITRSTDCGADQRETQIHFLPEIDRDGRVVGCFSISHDVTELKRLEARLQQAEKMQAIGQLTGGVAHDFNNLLGVVLGNLQLMERDIGKDHALSRKLSTAMRAALRGADLTRRLLAFARRQILDPVVLDLNRQLAGFGDLMQRTLGDSIETRFVLAADLWHTRVDPGQLENAILNLAINARDAMPEGGRLTVETRNMRLDAVFCLDHPGLVPGEYVMVSVTDSGCGIPQALLSRVFDPFFTTKELGKGSGLGLSMVHGFAKQSGGATTIESRPSRGTTVRIFLPRSIEEQATHEDTIVQKSMPGGSEAILVVEDDNDLRETAALALGQLGYRVFEAANGASALKILSGSERIDLLFTDIMMPGGMLGPALAKRACELRPGIGVLFTTGYADNTILESDGALAHVDVISKPYRNEELALRIRGLLDREARVA